MSGSEMVELEVRVLQTSAMALNVWAETVGRSAWVPKSVVDDYTSSTGELDSSTTGIFIPRWMAEQKGLV